MIKLIGRATIYWVALTMVCVGAVVAPVKTYGVIRGIYTLRRG